VSTERLIAETTSAEVEVLSPGLSDEKVFKLQEERWARAVADLVATRLPMALGLMRLCAPLRRPRL
jgi:hypothetical protein